jgi:hypothetical protein
MINPFFVSVPHIDPIINTIKGGGGGTHESDLVMAARAERT